MRPETDPNRLDAIWPEFVRDFHPLAVSLVGESDAPDLFQETYLEALRIEPRYKERYGNARNPRSRRFRVLVVILRRVAIHARRSEQKQMRAKASLTQVWMQNERDVNESRPIETPAPPLEDPGLEMVICRAQLSVLTQECLEDYRLGLPTSHSAKRLGISEGAAKAHLATAWKRLRAAAEVEMYHRMEEGDSA